MISLQGLGVLEDPSSTARRTVRPHSAVPALRAGSEGGVGGAGAGGAAGAARTAAQRHLVQVASKAFAVGGAAGGVAVAALVVQVVL